MRSSVPLASVSPQGNAASSVHVSSTSSQAPTQRSWLWAQYSSQVLPIRPPTRTLQPLDEQNSFTSGRLHCGGSTGSGAGGCAGPPPGAVVVAATLAHWQIRSDVSGHTSSHCIAAFTLQSSATSSQAPTHSRLLRAQYSAHVRPVMLPTRTLQPSSEHVALTSRSAAHWGACGFLVPEGGTPPGSPSGGRIVVVVGSAEVVVAAGSGPHSQMSLSLGRAFSQPTTMSSTAAQPSSADCQAPVQKRSLPRQYEEQDLLRMPFASTLQPSTEHVSTTFSRLLHTEGGSGGSAEELAQRRRSPSMRVCESRILGTGPFGLRKRLSSEARSSHLEPPTLRETPSRALPKYLARGPSEKSSTMSSLHPPPCGLNVYVSPASTGTPYPLPFTVSYSMCPAFMPWTGTSRFSLVSYPGPRSLRSPLSGPHTLRRRMGAEHPKAYAHSLPVRRQPATAPKPSRY
mmetsp:Transcript_109147/g.304241  ORF Transcript_109147/g.304241 Transcript_109147/m.304241 type:complete len:457 (-) Transcript_109147:864-2234(-)